MSAQSKALVLGLVGATGSGKTTLARALVCEFGFENIHMGRPLKDMLRALGLPETAVAGNPEERAAPQPILGGRSARYALSTLGTDWGRDMISPGLWANAVKAQIERRLQDVPTALLVIDDLRFPSDWTVVSDFGGLIIRVRRPTIEVKRTLLDQAYHRWGLRHVFPRPRMFGWSPIHETEFHWRDAPCCGEVLNSGSVADAVGDTVKLIGLQGRRLGAGSAFAESRKY